MKDSTADAEFWRKRADYYSEMCNKLIAEMCRGVKIESIEIDENGIKFIKKQPDLQPTCNQLATDTISRQAAIDALCRRCDLAAEDDEPCTEKCNDIKILEKLPSVEIFEIGKTYSLDGYEFEIKKGECGNSFVTIKRTTKNVWRKNGCLI